MRAGERRVLVLERHDGFGGAAAVYRHNSLSIEGSLHEIDGLDADDPKMPLLKLLDLDKSLAFVDVGAIYEVRGALIGDLRQAAILQDCAPGVTRLTDPPAPSRR